MHSAALGDGASFLGSRSVPFGSGLPSLSPSPDSPPAKGVYMDKFALALAQALDLFVRQHNRLQFQKLIDETKDTERRMRLMKFLAEEERRGTDGAV